jgi:hypothetical protein
MTPTVAGLRQAAALYSRVRKKDRFQRYLNQFIDENTEAGFHSFS